MAHNDLSLPTNDDFLAMLETQDPLAMVVRAHQAIEAALNAAIAESLYEPHAVEIHRLSAALKIDLGVGLQIIQVSDALALRKVNGLRNQLAHRSGATFAADDARDLKNTLSARQRYLMGEDELPDHLELLRRVLGVLFVQIVGARNRLREGKMLDQVLHEMVQDLLNREEIKKLGNLGPGPVDEEIRSRMEAKRRLQNP